MEPSVSVRDILAFHRVDRAAYDRLRLLGSGRQPARDAVALLMWLHRNAGIDAVAGLPAAVQTPAAAARLQSEVQAVLHRGSGGGARPPEHSAGTPLLSSLCRDDFGRLLALFPVDAPRRGVAVVLDGVGVLVFDDRLHALLRRHEEGGGALPAELASPYRRGGGAPPQPPPPPPPPPPPVATDGDEDGRSLFITFSKGFPLTREEIVEFFTGRWGAGCVERMMMEKTAPGELPAYGRVVCRREAVVAAVLGGRRLARLLVNGRHLWARRYVPRRRQPQRRPRR